MLVAFTEGVAVQVVQIRRIAGREQGPVTVFAHALDQQIGHPVRRIHVVGSAAFVAGILTQFQEFLDVQMPAFQVGTHRALAFAALVHRHGGVVDDFQEGHHALALAVGSFDVGAQRTDWRPVVTQTARPFRQHGVIADGAVDVFKIVAHRRQVTGRQLRMAGTAVEQGGCGGHVVERREQVVELNGTGVRVVFTKGQAHGNTHEKYLRQFQAGLVPVQEVTVVQGLQTQEAELQIPLRLKGSAEALQIESSQGFVQQFITNSRLDKGAQGLWINLSQWQTDGQAQGGRIFQPELLQQQSGGDGAVVRLPLNPAAGRHDQSRQHVFLGDAVIKVGQGIVHQGITVNALQPCGGLLHLQFHQAQIQRSNLATGLFHRQMGVRLNRRMAGALAGMLFPIQDVGAGHLLFFGPHQGQFHLILDVFDMYLATSLQATANRLDNLVGHPVYRVIDTRGTGGGVALNCEEGFGYGDADLRGVEAHKRAVALDDLKGFGVRVRGWPGFGQG